MPAVGPGAQRRLRARSASALADTFVRVEDPPYNPRQVPITRYNNQASAEVRWSPGGGRLTGTLRYTNMVDVFQGAYSYANSMTNQLMLDGPGSGCPRPPSS